VPANMFRHNGLSTALIVHPAAPSSKKTASRAAKYNNGMQLAVRGLGVASIIFALACATQGAPQGAESSSPKSGASASGGALAVVGGVEITEEDLNVRGELIRLQQEEYRIKNEALEEAIGAKLIEQEAKRRGVTVEQLEMDEVV